MPWVLRRLLGYRPTPFSAGYLSLYIYLQEKNEPYYSSTNWCSRGRGGKFLPAEFVRGGSRTEFLPRTQIFSDLENFWVRFLSGEGLIHSDHFGLRTPEGDRRDRAVCARKRRQHTATVTLGSHSDSATPFSPLCIQPRSAEYSWLPFTLVLCGGPAWPLHWGQRETHTEPSPTIRTDMVTHVLPAGLGTSDGPMVD